MTSSMSERAPAACLALIPTITALAALVASGLSIVLAAGSHQMPGVTRSRASFEAGYEPPLWRHYVVAESRMAEAIWRAEDDADLVRLSFGELNRPRAFVTVSVDPIIGLVQVHAASAGGSQNLSGDSLR
jgi:hypothetical protein